MMSRSKHPLIEECGSEYKRKILKTFCRGNRITAFPVKRKKRLIILERLLKEFEPERRYSEKEVNEILQNFHEDYCRMRRELVDEGYMTRKDGYYWIL